MKIHEYQAKEILKQHGILVPAGLLVERMEDADAKAEEIGFPLVIKAQVHVGGRGKAGAIKIVSDRQEFEQTFPQIFGMDVKGLKVEKVLLEQAVNIDRMFYVGIIVDRASQKNTMMLSAEGGVEIEEVAKATPEKIKNILLNDDFSFNLSELEAVVRSWDLTPSVQESFYNVVNALTSAYADIDAQLAEINPLVLTKDQQWLACDAKMVIDDNALFRHEWLTALKESAEDSLLEREAHAQNLAYVKLDGNIGIIGNGAGLVMATMDEVKRAGGLPANFLDIGGGAKKDVMRRSMEIIYKDDQVQGIFINIFGGITRCDEVAKGILEVIEDTPRKVPIVLRLAGTRSAEGRELLKNSRLATAVSMEEGAKEIVKQVNG